MFESILLAFLSLGISQVNPYGFEEYDPTCQNHFTQGYGYRLYMNLPSSSLLKDGSVQFNFSLTGPSDGHVLLAEKPNTYPAYEVVLGAGGNEFSEIRKYVSSKLEVKATQITKKILSVDEIRNFTITIQRPVIGVAKRNNQSLNTFMSWRDTSPLDVKYVSFCAWTGVTVNWYYDCKEAKPVPETLSTVKKLKRKLLLNYDPYSVPVQHDNKLMINTSIGLHYINLDAKKSRLMTHGKFYFTWHDFRIKWNPKEFDNISSINLLHREIWLPEFTLFNSFDPISSPMGKSVIKITNDGMVNWSPDAEMATWCDVELKEWPFDHQFCNISLGLYSHPQAIHVSLSNVLPELNLKKLEWEIVSVTGETTTIVNYWELENTHSVENQKAFMINVELKRQSQLYMWSFFIPNIASVSLIFVSFFLPVFCGKRLILHSTCSVLLMVNLLSLNEALPALPSSTPHIISVCSGLLFLSCAHVIFSTALMGTSEFYKSSRCPKIMSRIVSNPAVQTAFCLFGNYESMEEDNSLSDGTKNNSNEVNHSIMFGVILDRIVFSLSMMYIFILFIF